MCVCLLVVIAVFVVSRCIGQARGGRLRSAPAKAVLVPYDDHVSACFILPNEDTAAGMAAVVARLERAVNEVPPWQAWCRTGCNVWVVGSARTLKSALRCGCGGGGGPAAQVMAGLGTVTVNLHCPRFEAEQTSSMADVLKGLGVHEAFTDAARFGRMTPVPVYVSVRDGPRGRVCPPTPSLTRPPRRPHRCALFSHPLLCCDVCVCACKRLSWPWWPCVLPQRVLHRARVTVDEEGTVAAAATAVVMKTRCAVVRDPEEVLEIKLDRPFLFGIVNPRRLSVLFLGQINDV